METLAAALISGGLALLGTVITVIASQRKTQSAVESTVKTEMAVMQNEIKNLRKEVEKHNNFASRIPALEAKEQANEKAIARLENFHME